MQNTLNFKVLQASAGSGKTYAIVKEYLKLCLGSKARVDNFSRILAITFTNAAANEMKAKIFKALCEIVESEEVRPGTMEADLLAELGISDAELKANAQSLMTRIMHDYSSFCVSTIDAFVQKLSRAFARDLNLPGQYTVSIDTEEVAETVTQNIGLQINDENRFLVRLLVDFCENQFANERSMGLESDLSGFVSKLMTEGAFQKDENNNIRDLTQYQQSMEALNDKVKGFERMVGDFLAAFGRIEKENGLTVADYANGNRGFYSFINKLSKRQYELPKKSFMDVAETGKWCSVAAKKRIPQSEQERIGETLSALFSDFQTSFTEGFGQYWFAKSQRELLYLYALRSRIRDEFERLAQEDEVVHISEFNKLLNNVMGDFSVPFIYERIGERFQHVFVDEFQDTSIMQWQNLLPLIDNGLAMGKMSMVVGDGKQSIYRFRSGEVEQIVRLPEIYKRPDDEREAAFVEFEQKLKDNFSFNNLDTNYRSFSNVVEFNNDFFEATYSKLSGNLQKVYKDADATLGKTVSIRQKQRKTHGGLVQVELYDDKTLPDYCLKRVEELVRELTEKHGYAYRDITILTRKGEFGALLANHLNAQGIPIVSQVSILLKTSDKVQLLVNTLRYLIQSDNDLVIANVLYYRRLTQEPAFEGSLEGLFREVSNIAKGEKAIETVLGIGEAGVLSETLSKATCLYDLCASLSRVYHLEDIHDAFLDYFMEEVFKWQSDVREGIDGFLAFWDKKQDKLAVQSVHGNAVNIMSIHKSKGLEFNVVIYPDAIIDLDERPHNKSPEAWVRPEELGFGPIPNLEKVLFKMGKTAESLGGKVAQMVEKERESIQLDNLNLLYVAFTRAVQRLHVIAKQGKDDKPNVIRDFLSSHEDNKVQDAALGEGCEMYRFGNPDFSNPLEMKEEPEKRCAVASVSMDWMQGITMDPEPSLLWKSDSDALLPREWGELVHQLLAGIRGLEDMETVIAPALQDGTIDQNAADWIRDKFMQMAHHPLVGAAFDPSAKVKTECEILHNGEVKRLDRYAELTDVIYLLDYKTGKKDTKHTKQLKEYKDALRCLTDKEIRAYLVYLSEAEIEVDQVNA